MSAQENRTAVDRRVRELLDIYGSPDACAVSLLCDRHDPSALAYRIVSADLSVDDLSYGALREQSERFAAALAELGVEPGDRVATLMGKSRRYLVTLMAIWRLGAVHVPLFTAFAPSAIAYRLDGSRAKVVVCDEGQRAKLAPGDHMPAVPAWHVVTAGPASGSALEFDALLAAQKCGIAPIAVGASSPIIHIYTSGTTGNPKGVVVPLRALAAFHAYAEFGLGIRPDHDIYWCAADPGWAYGLYFGVLATFTTGVRSLFFEGGFAPESTFRILERERVTNFAAAPTVYRALRAADLRAGAGLALERASSAGEPLTPEVNDWAHETLGVAVHDHYGQTESGMLINNHHHPAISRPIKPGSMGIPMPGWSATVLEVDSDRPAPIGTVGRVAIDLPSSPMAWFAGYFGAPEKLTEKFSPDGRWYLTGDTGSVDADGYFHFSSRDDDVIIMAGYRIGPFEVESVIATHPAIAECAVIAVPDEVRGEVMEAFVVLREGRSGGIELEQHIQQWVKRNYAAHAFPRKVHFVESMPKTPSGKIQRYVLKQCRLDEIAEERKA